MYTHHIHINIDRNFFFLKNFIFHSDNGDMVTSIQAEGLQVQKLQNANNTCHHEEFCHQENNGDKGRAPMNRKFYVHRDYCACAILCVCMVDHNIRNRMWEPVMYYNIR